MCSYLSNDNHHETAIPLTSLEKGVSKDLSAEGISRVSKTSRISRKQSNPPLFRHFGGSLQSLESETSPKSLENDIFEKTYFPPKDIFFGSRQMRIPQNLQKTELVRPSLSELDFMKLCEVWWYVDKFPRCR